jgi:hypothetical protein
MILCETPMQLQFPCKPSFASARTAFLQDKNKGSEERNVTHYSALFLLLVLL